MIKLKKEMSFVEHMFLINSNIKYTNTKNGIK